jgi:hypothetical protein
MVMRLPVHIWIRQENACPREVAGYFIQLAEKLDERPRKMRLSIESSVPAFLDFDPTDGNPAVCVAGETCRFDIRRRWLPEHPIPLVFGPKPTVLLVDPVDGNRFRVRAGRRFSLPWWTYPLFSIVGAVAAVTLHPAAATFAFALLAVMAAAAVAGRWDVWRKARIVSGKVSGEEGKCRPA